jgi:transglutaminase-like putative cysteine protease
MRATIDRTPPVEPPATDALDIEQLTYLRQSRYCPSDRLSGFAIYELGHLGPSPELLTAVGDWVGSRLTYQAGSSGPLDSAVDSLFAGRGVCRDYAHLAITLLRALKVPARLVAVYAPGLWPMDFHAVVEAHVEGRWWVLDPTRLAPRTSLLRVSTGRDAADTAFLTVVSGAAELRATEVVAFTDGELPFDDHGGLVSLA